MKLFTIGDSISQGFMSLAAARTELSYSTLLAKCMGLTPGTDDYSIPLWGAGGLPINIESLLRSLQRQYGSDIRGPIEWPLALVSINKFLDDVETYYERGLGNISLPQAGRRQFYPNVSVAGFTITDAWRVTPRLCIDRIANDTAKGDDDGFFALPNAAFERTSHAVLNPSRDPQFDDYSQLRWLQHHHEAEGVENVIIWLGSNNALGTIVRMDVAKTDDAPSTLNMSLDDRNKYNLWSVEHFTEEYEALMERLHAILSAGKVDCKVFIATVPAITIAPLARGVGTWHDEPDPFGVLPNAKYCDRYTYFLFDQDYARRSGNSLTREQALEIDGRIAGYNRTIADLVAAYNGKKKPRDGRKVEYVLVDICDQLLRLAFKRNDGKPTYVLPPELDALNTLHDRTVNTVYYTVDRKGKMSAGGVFSLDGVHPSAIGHGLIAREFLLAFQKAGVPTTRDLDWNAVVASDTLYSNPISLMPELYDNTRLAEMLLDLLRLP